MQRAERDALLDLRDHLLGDRHRAGEAGAAVHDPVPHAGEIVGEPDAPEQLHHRAQRQVVIGVVQVRECFWPSSFQSSVACAESSRCAMPEIFSAPVAESITANFAEELPQFRTRTFNEASAMRDPRADWSAAPRSLLGPRRRSKTSEPGSVSLANLSMASDSQDSHIAIGARKRPRGDFSRSRARATRRVVGLPGGVIPVR